VFRGFSYRGSPVKEIEAAFQIIKRHMRAILDEYDTSQYQVVEALQGLLWNAPWTTMTYLKISKNV
jgi:hypothetical protein